MRSLSWKSLSWKAMKKELALDIQSFFKSPSQYWLKQDGAGRFYLICDMFGNLGVVGFLLALAFSHLGLTDWVLPLLGPSFLGLLIGFFGSLWEVLRGGKNYALMAVVVLPFFFAPPLTYLILASDKPVIHDITTDLSNPPAFDEVKKARPKSANPLTRQTKDLAQLQRQAYPYIKTLRFRRQNLHPAKVFEEARYLVHQKGWHLVSAQPDKGLIEATASTLLMGFQDDIVIRVKGAQEKNKNAILVDMRSVSRLGRSDLGANARRIKDFLDDLRAVLK